MAEIQVTDEKGVTHIFPDGSTPEMIAKVMNVQVGQQQSQPRTAMDSVKDFASSAWQQLNPVSAVEGLKQATAHPIDTYKSDVNARQQVYNKAEEAFKKGDYAGGAAHLLYSFVPFLGPQLSQAGTDLQQGNTAKGLGTSVGIGLNLAGPEVAAKVAPKLIPKGAANTLSQRMYQSALKPSVASYTTNEVKNMVNTGLQNEIPISAGGVEKLNTLIGDLRNKVKSQIQAGSDAGATIDPNAVASRTAPLKQRFANQVNPGTDIQAIDASTQEFLNNNPNPIPAAQAQDLKTGTYNQLRSKYGELGSATVESQKALARGIKEELETQFPEIKGLNAQESKFINLDGALDRAVRRIDNRDIFSLGGKLASTGAGLYAGMETGHGLAGAAAGLVMHKIMTDPYLQSRLAIALNKGARGTLTLGATRARVAGYVNALGNAANAASPGDQQNQ